MYVKCSIFKNNIAFRTLRSQTFQWGKKETPSSQNRDPNNQLVKLKLAVLEIQMSPSIPASWGALQGSVKSARPEHIEKCQQRCRSSVTKLAELIFKKKKPRQNWSRGHFEATQKANFSILKPNFWSGDTAMGMAHWHNPKRVNFFSNILQNHYFVR